jgi:hypothetical protein
VCFGLLITEKQIGCEVSVSSLGGDVGNPTLSRFYSVPSRFLFHPFQLNICNQAVISFCVLDTAFLNKLDTVKDIFVFATASRPAVGPTQSHIQ